MHCQVVHNTTDDRPWATLVDERPVALSRRPAWALHTAIPIKHASGRYLDWPSSPICAGRL